MEPGIHVDAGEADDNGVSRWDRARACDKGQPIVWISRLRKFVETGWYLGSCRQVS